MTPEDIATSANSLLIGATDGAFADLARLVRNLAERVSNIDTDADDQSAYESLSHRIHEVEGDAADLAAQLSGLEKAHEHLKAEMDGYGHAIEALNGVEA